MFRFKWTSQELCGLALERKTSGEPIMCCGWARESRPLPVRKELLSPQLVQGWRIKLEPVFLCVFVCLFVFFPPPLDGVYKEEGGALPAHLFTNLSFSRTDTNAPRRFRPSDWVTHESFVGWFVVGQVHVFISACSFSVEWSSCNTKTDCCGCLYRNLVVILLLWFLFLLFLLMPVWVVHLLVQWNSAARRESDISIV